jgi:hypothetical protein
MTVFLEQHPQRQDRVGIVVSDKNSQAALVLRSRLGDWEFTHVDLTGAMGRSMTSRIGQHASIFSSYVRSLGVRDSTKARHIPQSIKL